MLQKVPDQQERLQDYCSVTVFIQVLLLKGYGFDLNSFSHIAFQKTVSSDFAYNWVKHYEIAPHSIYQSAKLLYNSQLIWSSIVDCGLVSVSLIAVFLGRGHVDRLGPRLHPEPEQSRAVWECVSEKGYFSNSLEHAHFPLHFPAHPSSRVSTDGHVSQEERKWHRAIIMTVWIVFFFHVFMHWMKRIVARSCLWALKWNHDSGKVNKKLSTVLY